MYLENCEALFEVFNNVTMMTDAETDSIWLEQFDNIQQLAI